MEIFRLTSSRALPITFIPRDFAVRLIREIYGVCRTRHAAASPATSSLANLESDFLSGEETRGNNRKRDREKSTSTGSPGAFEWRAEYELMTLSRSRFRGRLASRGEREFVTSPLGLQECGMQFLAGIFLRHEESEGSLTRRTRKKNAIRRGQSSTESRHPVLRSLCVKINRHPFDSGGA